MTHVTYKRNSSFRMEVYKYLARDRAKSSKQEATSLLDCKNLVSSFSDKDTEVIDRLEGVSNAVIHVHARLLMEIGPEYPLLQTPDLVFDGDNAALTMVCDGVIHQLNLDIQGVAAFASPSAHPASLRRLATIVEALHEVERFILTIRAEASTRLDKPSWARSPDQLEMFDC